MAQIQKKLISISQYLHLNTAKFFSKYIDVIIAITIVLFAFPIKFSTSFTNTGTFSFYISYGLLLCLAVYFFVFFLFKFKSLEGSEKLLTLFWLSICFSYVFVACCRLILKYNALSSLLIAFSTACPVVLFLVTITHKRNWKRGFTLCSLIVFVFNIFYIIIHIFVLKSLRSNFLINVNAVILLQIVFLFPNVFLMSSFKFKNGGFFFWIISTLNIAFAIISFFVLGSRLGLVIGLVTVILLLSLNFCRTKSFIRGCVAICTLSVVVIATMLYTNFLGAQHYFLRATSLDTFFMSSQMTIHPDDIGGLDFSEEGLSKYFGGELTEFDRDKQVLIANDAVRINYWKSALKNFIEHPIIGSGDVVVSVVPQYGSQTAHNFILEYALCFGGIGLTLWAIFAGGVVVFMFQKIRNRGSDMRLLLCTMVVVAVTCGYSLLQPTLSLAVITSSFWFVLGNCYNMISNL